MSAAILAVISRLPQLRGSLRHTAQRLAYFADGTGHVRKSYSFLAQDMHVSERTVIRHVQRLQDLCIISKQILRLTMRRCATNVYTFLVGAAPLHKRSPDTVAEEQAKREKSFAREAHKEHPKSRTPWFLSWLGLREGSLPWQGVVP